MHFSGIQRLEDVSSSVTLGWVAVCDFCWIFGCGNISNETNTDVCMYIEEFILVEMHTSWSTNWNWFTLEITLAFIQLQQYKGNVSYALRSQLT